MAAPQTVAIFAPNDPEVMLATEQPHPADARFVAYQLADGRWVGVDPQGNVTLTTEVGSYQAFIRLDGVSYLLADRTAFGGGAFRVGYGRYTPPSGPSA